MRRPCPLAGPRERRQVSGDHMVFSIVPEVDLEPDRFADVCVIPERKDSLRRQFRDRIPGDLVTPKRARGGDGLECSSERIRSDARGAERDADGLEPVEIVTGRDARERQGRQRAAEGMPYDRQPASRGREQDPLELIVEIASQAFEQVGESVVNDAKGNDVPNVERSSRKPKIVRPFRLGRRPSKCDDNRRVSLENVPDRGPFSNPVVAIARARPPLISGRLSPNERAAIDQEFGRARFP